MNRTSAARTAGELLILAGLTGVAVLGERSARHRVTTSAEPAAV